MRALMLLISTLAWSSDASATELQVAVLFDTNLRDRWVQFFGPGLSKDAQAGRLPDRARRELAALEDALRAGGSPLELAIVTCGEEPRDLHHLGFDPSLSNLAGRLDAMLVEQRGCSLDADAIAHAIDSLVWKRHAEKRILIVSAWPGFGMSGRTTAEEAVHGAERAGIVVHAIEFFTVTPVGDNVRVVATLAHDLRDFLERPTAPLGRVPSLLRHATLLSGGSYFAGPANSHDPRKTFLPWTSKPIRELEVWRSGRAIETADAFRARLGAMSLAERSHGRRTKGRDGLDDVADGLRRPSEVHAHELPTELHGIDLEPLLDAVWNYVDARRVVARLVLDSTALLENPDVSGGALGLELGKAMLGPRRLPPSRR